MGQWDTIGQWASDRDSWIRMLNKTVEQWGHRDKKTVRQWGKWDSAGHWESVTTRQMCTTKQLDTERVGHSGTVGRWDSGTVGLTMNSINRSHVARV